MTSYILELEQDKNGDLFVTLPDDLIDSLGWEENDVLDWKIKGESIILSKLNDVTGLAPIEDEF